MYPAGGTSVNISETARRGRCIGSTMRVDSQGASQAVLRWRQRRREGRVVPEGVSGKRSKREQRAEARGKGVTNQSGRLRRDPQWPRHRPAGLSPTTAPAAMAMAVLRWRQDRQRDEQRRAARSPKVVIRRNYLCD
ncbi:unnamed protein product, partial [Phaeothamnion confervicola]